MLNVRRTESKVLVCSNMDLYCAEKIFLGRTKEVLCARVLGTSLGTKSCAGLGTESWNEVLLRSLGVRPSRAEGSKSLLRNFVRSLMRALVKSYVESYAVL